MRKKYLLIAVLIAISFVKSCGTYFQGAFVNIKGIDRSGYYLPFDRRGDIMWDIVAFDVLATGIMVSPVFLLVDAITGRLYEEKLSDIVDNSITYEEIENSSYAYVIGTSNATIQFTHISERFDEMKNKNNKFLLTLDGIYPQEYYFISKVNPGKYTITGGSYNYQGSSKEKFVSDDLKRKNEELKHDSASMGYVELQAGKIYYLGHIHFDVYSDKLYVKLVNGRSATVNEISRKYIKLKNVNDRLIDNLVILK